MTIKYFLTQALCLSRLIDTYKEEIIRLRQLAASAPSTLSERVQMSGRQDKVGELGALIADSITDLEASIKQLVHERKKIRNVIYRVPDPLARAILIKRYLHFERWEQIAVDLDISLRWVFRIHKRILSVLSKKYNYPLQE
jgi:DNA-directed RNA polymerase specialized sigma subunit